jgi:hypothetical protein
MKTISCEVMTIENDEEVTVGHINVYSVPRVCEYLWFSEKLRGHSSWIVDEVCHWVGNGQFGAFPQGYQKCAIYVKPTKQS